MDASSFTVFFMEESLQKERSLLQIPAGIPGQLTVLVFPSRLSSSFLPFPLLLPDHLLRGTWNTLEVVDKV